MLQGAGLGWDVRRARRRGGRARGTEKRGGRHVAASTGARRNIYPCS